MTDLNHLNNLNEMRGPGKCDYTLISKVIYRIWQINQQLKGDYRAINATESALEITETSYVYAALVGVWPVSGGWAFNARLGVAIWDMDYTQLVYDASVTDPAGAETQRVESLSDTTSATLFGVGVSYGLTSTLEIKLGLETHLAEFAFTNLELENDLHLLQLGLAYHF